MGLIQAMLKKWVPSLARAGYDSAKTTENNRRHWKQADGLSADGAASPDVRRILRNRARYEVANNTYAAGIISTLANDMVGTGPRLQLLSPDRILNRAIEIRFMEWASATNLPEKLRTMRQSRAQDGEAFGILATNPAVRGPVKLDVRLIEADQVCTPWGVSSSDGLVDGIRFDAAGNPTHYLVLREHPGSTLPTTLAAYDEIPASSVIHVFQVRRPGQSRGIPEITPALPLFAQLRRYTLAVLSAAETAANNAYVLQTDAFPEEPEFSEDFDTVEFERNMATVLPPGYKAAQMKAEQPTTTYTEFKREILNEIARCLNMPFNVAAGNSSGYNYASGRLDHQTYFKSIRVDQAVFAERVLSRILSAWLEEALRVPGYLPTPLPAIGPDGMLKKNDPRTLLSHSHWFWDGMEHVDPMREAKAQATRLSSLTTTLASEYARQGKDWEVEVRQIARERELLDELGLTATDMGDDDGEEQTPEDDAEAA